MINPEIERKNTEEFCRISIEHKMLEHGGDAWIDCTCQKCGHRQIIKKYKMMAVDSVVAFIMDLYDRSELLKEIVINRIREQNIKGMEEGKF